MAIFLSQPNCPELHGTILKKYFLGQNKQKAYVTCSTLLGRIASIFFRPFNRIPLRCIQQTKIEKALNMPRAHNVCRWSPILEQTATYVA